MLTSLWAMLALLAGLAIGVGIGIFVYKNNVMSRIRQTEAETHHRSRMIERRETAPRAAGRHGRARPRLGPPRRPGRAGGRDRRLRRLRPVRP